MIDYIKYSVTFDWPQRTLAEEITFQKGFGTVTGPNESGKSFMLEMIRWMLFGSKALRGEASTYKKLTGLLKFKVRGEAYQVERTANSATLQKGDKVIAVGTSPVNVKIVQIFGYGLDVFDVANVVNQAELTKFGEMKPTERKRMVDNVIGLGIIDALSKMADNERLEASREVKSILDYVREPKEPEKPDDYVEAKVLKEMVERRMDLSAQANKIMGVLSTELIVPKPPQPTQLSELKTLLGHLDRKLSLKAELDLIEKSIPRKPQWTKEQLDEMSEQLDAHDRYNEAQAWLRSHPAPAYDHADVDRLCEQKDKYDTHQRWLHVTQTLDDLRKEGTHTCPKCGETSFISQKTIDGLERELARFHESASQHVDPVLVDLPLARAQAAAFREIAAEHSSKGSVPKPAAVVLSRGEVAFHHELIAKWEANQANVRRAATIRQEHDMMPDYQTMVDQRREFDAQMINYAKARELYATALEQRKVLTAELEGLQEKITQLDGSHEKYTASALYESAMVMYSKDKAEWDETMEVVKEKQDTADEWTKAKLGLVDFRTKVKQHLIPSLNLAASALLMQMTAGQRQSVYIDDDFNVLIDGQGLHTLSGSGQVIANLALRIGLGRVLTNNVFSVFIADEIDGSMDPLRAENTALTVKNLCGKVSQILLITHKYPEADYYIKLGNENDS